jgi:hypothetical protein
MAKKASQSSTRKAPVKRRPKDSPQVTAKIDQVSSLHSVGLAVISVAIGVLFGVMLAGGITVDGGSVGPSDVLAECHAADRASQVRILREYAGQTFANDSSAQKWLNEQRIAARPIDWTPYTDELGKRCAEGPEAVKAFADELEVKP